MSYPSLHPLRKRRGWRRRRRYALELLLGLVVLAAGTGLLVLDERAPEVTQGTGSSASDSPPQGDGTGGASATATAPAPEGRGESPADDDGNQGGNGNGDGGGGDPDSAEGTQEGDGESERGQSPEPQSQGGETGGLPALTRSIEDEVRKADGDMQVVPGESEVSGEGPRRRYLVEVEEGLPGKAADFADATEQILADARSWRGEEGLSMQRVDEGPVDFRVALAAPETVDRMCAPLETLGRVSCTTGGRAIINQNRWVSGVPHFNGDLSTYRIYVINHEVGHALGHGHVDCPGKGEPAPVMQQQTFGLQGCEPHGWVTR